VLDYWSELNNIIAGVDYVLKGLILTGFLGWVVQMVKTEALAAATPAIHDQRPLLVVVIVSAVPTGLASQSSCFVLFKTALVK
jgi:hypothetical protein